MPTERAPPMTARAPKKMMTMRSSPNSKVLTIVKIMSILPTRKLCRHPIDKVVVPDALAPITNRQRFDARHPAQRFEEMRVLVRSIDDRFLVGPTVEPVSQAAHQCVDARDRDRE